MKRLLAAIMICVFTLSSFKGVCAPGPLEGETAFLPSPGRMASTSPFFQPPVLKGLKVYADEPFRLDFILDKGDLAESREQRAESREPGEGPDSVKDSSMLHAPGSMLPALTAESTRLIKYFLASLTIPEKDLWVNLSPYEKDRIVPEAFGRTEMGRDLLAQDYLLKQLTASVLYPEGETGKEFWKKVYAQAYAKYGTTDIPVDTFNKVWITPDRAVVYENGISGSAYIVESRLKVMLEQDYFVSTAVGGDPLKGAGFMSARERADTRSAPTHNLAKQVLKEIVIPVLEKEVNEGANFAPLRQVYQSLILAAWYKKKVMASLLSETYVDKNKVQGLQDNPLTPDAIWTRYVESFKKGAFNLVREEADPFTDEHIPRKYFSGGMDFAQGLSFALVIIPSQILPPMDDLARAMVVRTAVRPVGLLAEEQGVDKADPAQGDKKRDLSTTVKKTGVRKMVHLFSGQGRPEKSFLKFENILGGSRLLRAMADRYSGQGVYVLEGMGRAGELREKIWREAGNLPPRVPLVLSVTVETGRDRLKHMVLAGPSDVFQKRSRMTRVLEGVSAGDIHEITSGGANPTPYDFILILHEDKTIRFAHKEMLGNDPRTADFRDSFTVVHGAYLKFVYVIPELRGRMADVFQRLARDLHRNTSASVLGLVPFHRATQGFAGRFKEVGQDDFEHEHDYGLLKSYFAREYEYDVRRARDVKVVGVDRAMAPPRQLRPVMAEYLQNIADELAAGKIIDRMEGARDVSYSHFKGLSSINTRDFSVTGRALWRRLLRDRKGSQLEALELGPGSGVAASQMSALAEDEGKESLIDVVGEEAVAAHFRWNGAYYWLKGLLKEFLETAEGLRFKQQNGGRDPELTLETVLLLQRHGYRVFDILEGKGYIRQQYLQDFEQWPGSGRKYALIYDYAGPFVYAHNIESRARLYPKVLNMLDDDGVLLIEERFNPDNPVYNIEAEAEFLKESGMVGDFVLISAGSYPFSAILTRRSSSIARLLLRDKRIRERKQGFWYSFDDVFRIQDILEGSSGMTGDALAPEAAADRAMSDAGKKKAGFVSSYWLAGLRSIDRREILRVALGNGIGDWLEKVSASKGTEAERLSAVQWLVRNRDFRDALQDPARDIWIEAVRIMVREGKDPGTKSLGIFSADLKDKVGAEFRSRVPVVGVSFGGYADIIAAIGRSDVQDLFMSARFQRIDRTSRMGDLLRMIEHLGLPLGTESLGKFYVALPQDVRQMVARVGVPLSVFRQVSFALQDKRVMDYVLEEERAASPDGALRLVRLMKKIIELGLPLDTRNLEQFYSALPGDVQAGLIIVSLTLKDFEAFREALGLGVIAGFLDSPAFLQEQPKDRLKVLLDIIRTAGISLESKSLKGYYQALPLALTSRIRKSDFLFPRDDSAMAPPRQLRPVMGDRLADTADYVVVGQDHAPTPKGGIDLNVPADAWQVRSAGHDIKFSISPAALARFQDAFGLKPVIMSIRPLEDFGQFWGHVGQSKN